MSRESQLDPRKGVALIIKKGAIVELKIGKITFDHASNEFVIRVPHHESDEPLKDFPTLADAINLDRLLLLRLLKRIKAIQLRAKTTP